MAMATLIRIKRPLANEPAENIVVKLKRRKLEGASEGEEENNVLPTGVLQRVATVSSKVSICFQECSLLFNRQI